MFEIFDVKTIHFKEIPCLAMFSSGYLTGLVLECGYGVCIVVTVKEGYYLPHCLQRLDIAGQG